jgi:hypothetical protein
MHSVRSSQRIAAIAAFVAILALWPGRRGTTEAGPGQGDRILTLTVSIKGTGNAMWDAKVQDPRDKNEPPEYLLMRIAQTARATNP